MQNRNTVFITGATAGIGWACVHIFAEHGWRVIALGRREEKLTQLKNELHSKYPDAELLTLQADVRYYNQLQEKMQQLPDEWRQINVLVNNAGLALGKDAFDQANVEDWDTMIDTNIKGLLYATKAVLPYMPASGIGRHIINIGSIAGKEVYAQGSVYCATKFAVDALSKGMRIDLLEQNIKVTAINPGLVETEFSVVRFKGDEQKAKSVYEGYTPLTANDIADVVFFAVSRPANVNISEITLTPLAQAGAHYLTKKSSS
ncbi:MAG TPA: SDR family NAD(P)-dependent oxidoreductase [Chitinophagales bacterium]|nr:SDR family NAD(P)-dependent oxidoreductase [Chitinophagales bacterium]HRK27293.1 SDR family NAD(P)-dependent oxidoreductase [Chitinophagales bacterium]